MFANRETHLFVVVNAACKAADLAHMRAHDPAPLTLGLAATAHRLWAELSDALAVVTGSQIMADLALRWLVGQVLNPLTPDDSRLQAELLISRANL